MPIAILILSVILLDQFSKLYIQEAMTLGMSCPVLAGVLHITYILNPGAAFGILENQRIFFIVVAVAMIAFLIYFYPRLASYHMVFRIGTALLTGGAVGNLIDRMRIGAVVDFIDFRVWPIFNIADIAIVCGVAMMMYVLLFLSNEKEGGHESE